MQRFVDEGEIAGTVTVVGRHDRVLSREAVGMADVEAGRPMARDTLFRIASMTKPITATAVMILAEQGGLSIDDPVEKHLPEFRAQMLAAKDASGTVRLKPPHRKATIRDLLTHTSGLPSGLPADLAELYLKRDRTLAEVIPTLAKRPLEFEPGSRWAYCNAGIDTLGRIVEVVSGRRFETFLQERIFSPLGMKDTTFYPDRSQRRRMATLYDRKDGKLLAAGFQLLGPTQDARYPIPAGGLYSTGGDLARFYQMMLCGGQREGTRILSEKSVRQMTTLQTGSLTTGFVPGMGFGLGWGVVHQPQGVTAAALARHFGHGGAFGTQGWLDPKQDLFVILLIQRLSLANGDASEMRAELQRLAVAAIK